VTPGEPVEVRLHALGTEIVLRGEHPEAAALELVRFEGLLTRFRPSPVTRLNERGRLDDPPPELVSALRHALDVAERTDGLITPLVQPALVAAGYAASWPDVSGPATDPPATVRDWRGVHVGPTAIELPPGAGVDLGGTGKSWIAERLVARLGPGEVLVDAGGDVALRSDVAAALDIAAPHGGDDLQVLLPAGRWGVATSSVLGRSWPGAHHLIDPRTGLPARGEWVQATVVEPDLRRAEVLAKLVLLGAIGSPRRPADPGDAGTLTALSWSERAALVVAFDRGGRPWRLHGADWRAA